MGVEFHATHQLFGQRQDLFLSAKNMVDGDAAGNLLEVLALGRLEAIFRLLSLTPKLDLSRQGAPLEVVLLNTPDKFQYYMIEVDGDGSILADVRFKRLFATDTLPLPLTDNRPVIDAA